MPLSGGPSEKLGDRYEVRVVVRRMLDLLTGRLDSLRLEVPGEDAIDFRCASSDRVEAHQVKRGISGGGHWTIAALSGVLDGFGKLLVADLALSCVFTSEHAASELKELSERARDAQDLPEFSSKFLGAQWLKNAWAQLREIWGTDERQTYEQLQRISVVVVSEDHLQENTDAILQLLVEKAPAAARAVLVEFALESVHREVRAVDVEQHLTKGGIRLIKTGGTEAIARTVQAPPAVGIRRGTELAQIEDLLNAGKSTIFIGGISGIGKTVVASQFAAEAKVPICWIECDMLTSETEALSAIGEFLVKHANDNSVSSALSRGDVQLKAVARLAGRRLAAHRCVLVWDGLDGVAEEKLRPTVDSIASSIAGGSQLVTAQEINESGRAAASAIVHVGRLDKGSVRSLLANAYPEARVPQLEEADEITQGHPYLVQLLIGASSNVDLDTALATISTSGGSAFVSELLSTLASDRRLLLSTLAWLGFPFSAAYASRLGGTPAMLNELASRSLILRAGGDTYRVHEIVAKLIAQTTTDDEQREIRERIALFLRGLENPTWFEVRAMLAHARAASLHEIARQAGRILLNFSMRVGLWTLAHEAAQSLIQDPESSPDWYAHFVLGKYKRMTEEFEAALEHYTAAETRATEVHARESCQYERASVLCGLGRREDADPLYEALCRSDDPGMRIAAKIGLALGIAGRSDVESAMAILADALQEARNARLQRAEAEVEQSMGFILADAERWSDARVHLEQAHNLRMSLEGEHGLSIYGWYQLLAAAFRVERALGNREDAAEAAHGLYRFALASGSLVWEADSAQALCLAEPDANDREVVGALARLRAIGADAFSQAQMRVIALVGLVLCEWTLRHYEEAMEALLDLQSLREEHSVDGPFFTCAPDDGTQERNIIAMPEGDAFALLVPAGETPEFVYRLVDGIIARRPELAQYAVVIEAVQPNASAERDDAPDSDAGGAA